MQCGPEIKGHALFAFHVLKVGQEQHNTNSTYMMDLATYIFRRSPSMGCPRSIIHY